MQHNYYFLKKLSRAFAQRFGKLPWFLGVEAYQAASANLMLSDCKLGECFSQSKGELILGFYRPGEDYYLRASLQAHFACLSLSDSFARAKKNSINLFEVLIDRPLVAVVQHLNERAFSLCFSEDYQLLFKMHGRRANLVLFKNNEVVALFHNKMQQDNDLQWAALDRPIAQDYEAFVATEANLPTLFPTFGKAIKQYLAEQGFHKTNDIAEKWEMVQACIEQLEQERYYLQSPANNLPVFSLLPLADAEVFENPIEALNNFYYQYARFYHLNQEKQQALRLIQKEIRKAEAYLKKNFERYAQLEEGSRNEEIANIIMANLQQIPARSKTVMLFDFYQDKETEIKLNPHLSPQKNAENYYRKSKNEKIERQTLEKNLARKEEELEQLRERASQIDAIEDLRGLRKYLRQNPLNQRRRGQKSSEPLFKKFSYNGFEIWVGKNAKNNDLLTQQYAYKEDLWLHAKDVSGSHVVIKYQSGKTFPKDVIEKAAALAAYYSKRSSDSLCPVIYTPRKFVRKTKDLAAGQVLVDKEEVLMVIPEKF